MPITDFSLDNPLIKGYFEGTSTYVPSGEFLYVHTHYVEHNFLSQIETQILVASAVLAENPRKKGVAQKLLSLAERLSTHMNKIDDASAKEILPLLREIYELCGRIIS